MRIVPGKFLQPHLFLLQQPSLSHHHITVPKASLEVSSQNRLGKKLTFQKICTKVHKYSPPLKLFLFLSNLTLTDKSLNNLRTNHLTPPIASKTEIRGVIRTQSNIYDGAFLRQQLTVFTRYLFSQKISIVDD